MSLALGDPITPYAIARAMVLHLPSGLIPVHARASLSKARILESETPAPSCPHVEAECADPENNCPVFYIF